MAELSILSVNISYKVLGILIIVGLLGLFTYAFILIGRIKKKRNMLSYNTTKNKMISGLLYDYEAIIMVEYETGEITIIRLTEEFNDKWGCILPSNRYMECVSSGVKNIVLPDDREKVLSSFDINEVKEALKKDACFKVSFRIVVNNKPTFIEAKFTQSPDENVKGFILGTRNVDKETRENIKAQEDTARNSVLLNVLSSDYVCVVYYNFAEDETSVVKFVDAIDSEVKEKFYAEKDKKGFLNKYILKYVHEDDVPLFDECLSPSFIKIQLMDRMKFSFVYRRMLPDGSYRYMEMTFARENAIGEELEVVVIGFADIDEFYRNKLEDKRVHQQDKETISQLQEEKDIEHTFAEQFVETYISAFYINLVDGSFKPFKTATSVNMDFSAFDNYQQVIDSNLKSKVSPEEYDKILMYSKPEYIRSILAKNGHFNYTFPGMINGQKHFIKVRIVRGQDENHAGVGFIDVNDEVIKEKREKAQLEENLKIIERQQKELQESNIAKTRFLFNMSHDIRTPLNAVNGYTNLILSHPDNVEKVMEYGNKILASGEHLLNLINELLDMSRIEADVIRSDIKAVNLIDQAKTMYDICHENAIGNGIELEYHTNLQDENLYVDELHLNQILMNVISNAIKYSKQAGLVKYEITQIPCKNENYARIRFEISDNGIGMSEEFKNRIFDSFSRERTTTISGIQGTGLGMAIVKKLVDFMDGEIIVESEQDKGTKVTIEFEFRKVEEIKTEKSAEHKDFDFDGYKVLVVEDNEMNREIVVEILKEINCIPYEAEDGQQAVNMVSDPVNGAYDLILMDIQMPILNGYEATMQIRKLPVNNDIPIVALSANAFEDDIKRSLDSGMDAHIPKPIDMKQLLTTMETVIKTPQIGKTG